MRKFLTIVFLCFSTTCFSQQQYNGFSYLGTFQSVVNTTLKQKGFVLDTVITDGIYSSIDTWRHDGESYVFCYDKNHVCTNMSMTVPKGMIKGFFWVFYQIYVTQDAGDIGSSWIDYVASDDFYIIGWTGEVFDALGYASNYDDARRIATIMNQY